jgi:hypothetical protein
MNFKSVVTENDESSSDEGDSDTDSQSGIESEVDSQSSSESETNIQDTREADKDEDEILALIEENLDPSIGLEEAKGILKEYKNTLNTLEVEQKESKPSLTYMVQLLNDWSPRKDIICLLLRWRKRPSRNFHSDSISSLLCLAGHCKVSPQNFLKKIKTLTISKCRTGVKLQFEFHTRKLKSEHQEQVSRQVVGLTLTLDMLMKEKISSACPPVGFSLLYKKLMRDVQHRWLSLHLVEILFPTQLAKSDSEKTAMVFSFKMHSTTGRSRFKFLEPIVGVCLRYRTTEMIDNNKESLHEVWEKPETFVQFGKFCLQNASSAETAKYISECFLGMLEIIDGLSFRSSLTATSKTSREVFWQMIRSFAFQFWLDRINCNELKKTVFHLLQLNTSHFNQKPKAKKTPLLVEPVAKAKQWRPDSNWLSKDTLHQSRKILSTEGLNGLLTTRKRLYENISNETVPAMEVQPREEQDRLIDSSDRKLLTMKWNEMTLASKMEMSSQAASFLVIHQEGMDIVSKLSPIEVYMAEDLFKFYHYRQTGGPSFYPTDKIGDIVLQIGYNVDKFVNKSMLSFQICREESSIFEEHQKYLPTIPQCSRLCNALVKHGSKDVTRCKTQYRVNIGNGGQHRPTGIPEVLIGLGFRDSLQADPEFDEEEVMETIGTLAEFVWRVLSSMQKETESIPMAPDKRRHQMYALHLAKYLGMNVDVGFEDITISVGILDKFGPNLVSHPDWMNDSVPGYTKTGAFQIVLISNDRTMVLLQVICNFRKVIREYVSTLYSSCSTIVTNCKEYLGRWQNNVTRIFEATCHDTLSPFDSKRIL